MHAAAVLSLLALSSLPAATRAQAVPYDVLPSSVFEVRTRTTGLCVADEVIFRVEATAVRRSPGPP